MWIFVAWFLQLFYSLKYFKRKSWQGKQILPDRNLTRFLFVLQAEVCDPHPRSLKLEKERGSSSDAVKALTKAVATCLGFGDRQTQAGNLCKLLKLSKLPVPQP